MAQSITVQPIPVLIDGHDTEGMLVLSDGRLVAVLARLDGKHHGVDAGKWHLEAGLGRCAPPPGESLVWDTPQDGARWVETQLSDQPR